MNGIHVIHKERLPLHYQQEVCSFYLNFVNKQTQQVENIVSLSFQIIADLVTMPPKSDYWKCFVVQGVLAVCQLSGCPKPNVSLGALPKPGQKKRISEYKLCHSCSQLKCFLSASGAVTNHLAKHHQSEWNAYCETRARKAAVASEVKEEVKESCEMENSEVRFYDVRSSKGRLPFLNKSMPDSFNHDAHITAWQF